MKFSTIIIALPLSLLLFSSCGEGDKDEVVQESVDSTANSMASTANDTTKFKFDFAIANIPSPANRMHEVVAFGVPYDNSLLNDTKHLADYTTEYKRSINMGIYNMDMAYAMMNDAGQDVLNYMKNIILLSEALGMQSSINSMVGQRFETNINNKDSLFSVWDEILIKSDTYLRSNERVYTASIVFSGSWLESLYLSTRVSEKVTDSALRNKARTNLWEQRMHLGNLINLLSDYKDKKECMDLLSDLQPIYNELVSNRQPSELSEDDYSSLSKKIITLRNKVVSK